MSREASIRADEFEGPIMVLLLPETWDWQRTMSRNRQLRVRGLKAPIRVWLRPAHEVEVLFERFCRKRVVPMPSHVQDDGTWRMKRSAALVAWWEWFDRNAAGVRRPGIAAVRRLFIDTFGKPRKLHGGHYGWSGYRLN